MVLSSTDYMIYGIGAFILVVWLILFFLGLKHKAMFDVLEEKDFPLKELYGMGYAFVLITKYKYHSSHDRKLRKEISVLYGEKYSDYYIRVIYSQKISIALTVLALAVPLYGLSNSLAVAFVIIMFSALAYYYFGTVTENKIKKRSEELLSDFSNVVSKLALLTNAGMILREAWEDVAFTGTTELYKEMQKTVDEMRNGVSEIDAFFNFGTRCIVPEIKKFTSTIVQGLVKGNSELVMLLQAQSKEVWDAKKQNVRRQGAKAASKLLIPIMIMFVGILIMVLIPIFTNMGV